MGHAPSLVGFGAVTALGNGVERILDAVRTNTSALRAHPDLQGRGYAAPVVGRIPADAEAAIARDCTAPEDARAWRLAREAARQALDGSTWPDCPVSRRGLVLSTTKADLAAFERVHRGQPCSPEARRHAQPALLAEDLARAVAAAGPVRCVSAACVSGLLALQQAARLIQRDTADAVLVVGVDLITDFVLTGFASLKSLDPEGCRPFDRDRVGLSVGEAGSAILLMRPRRTVSPAWRLTGWGSSNDANHLTGPSRDGSGLALAMQRALDLAGLTAGKAGYLHAHGTGTPYNDAMECHAFRRVFGDSTPPFGSSKGLFGHTLGAAGLLETLVCVKALEAGWLPGTPRLAEVDPTAPGSVLREPKPAGATRAFLKVNCGFGGTNAAVVVQRNAFVRP